jgi:hypothetical protein
VNEHLRNLAGKSVKIMLSGTGHAFWGPYVVGKVHPTGATVVMHSSTSTKEYIVSVKHIVMVFEEEE